MDLWVVILDYGPYENKYFLGVFDSEEKALAAIGKASHSRDDMEVKKMTLNEMDKEYL